MQDANNMDHYARHLEDLFSVVEGKEFGSMEGLPVLDLSVQRILNGIRESALHSLPSVGLLDTLKEETSSRISCVTALAVSLTEPEVRVGPTLMVVVSALVSEHCGKVSISPVEMLRGIAARLTTYARESTNPSGNLVDNPYQASVRDACLLTMLRLSAECDEIPEEVTDAVRRVSRHSSAHLRRVGSTYETHAHTLTFIIRGVTNS